jgi:hypothetical protein
VPTRRSPYWCSKLPKTGSTVRCRTRRICCPARRCWRCHAWRYAAAKAEYTNFCWGAAGVHVLLNGHC